MVVLASGGAVVTGASIGIGAGLGGMVGAEGAHVVLAAGRAEAMERVATDIRQAGGVAVPVVTDLADDTSLANLVARTRGARADRHSCQQRRLRRLETARSNQHG